MLYEMVTGRVPYEAETPMAVVIKHITAPLPLPSSVKPDIPLQVERMVLKAMAKDPDDRFQTVGEMVAALDAAVRLVQVEAPAAVGELAVAKEAAPPSKGFLARAMAGVGEATQTGWGRTAMWAALGVVTLLAFFLALSRVPLKVQIRGGQLEVVRVVEATITSEAAAPATTPVLSEVEGPTEAVAAGATASPAPLPTVVVPSPTREEGAPPEAAAPTLTPMGRIVYSDGKTGNDEIYVANSDGSDEQRLTDRPAGDWEPAWSPDGTRIVFDSDHHAIGKDRNQLYVVDADGSNLTRLTYTEGNEEHPSWSPDGSRIAFHSNCGLAVINADGSNWTTLVEGGEGLCVRRPTWSPDSQRIAFKSIWPSHHGLPGPYQQDIYVVNDDGSGLSKLATFTSEEWGGWYAVWSPDGSQVAFDIVLDGQERYYAVSSDGSGEPVEIPSIPDSWYPWYWPQWGGEEEARLPSMEATPASQPTAVPIPTRTPRPTPPPVPTAAPPDTPTSPPSAGTGSATGRILWNDEPFAGVVVKLCIEWSMISGCKGAEYTAVSGADGRYTTADLPPGSYRIATQIPGQENETGWMGMRAEVQSGEVAQVKDFHVVKYDLQLLSPHEEEAVKTAEPALTWAGYAHAAYYKVYLAPWGGGEAVIQFEKTAETTYTVDSPLQVGKYHWSIHAYNAQGTKLAEGSGRFTVAGN